MSKEEETEDLQKEYYKLIFVKTMGVNSEGQNVYEFLFTENDPNDLFVDNWEYMPSSNVNLTEIIPEYDLKRFLITDIKLDMACKSSCTSFMDCKDGVIAVAWENVDLEYPSEGKRLVFPYGEMVCDVETKLYLRGLSNSFVETYSEM